MSVKNSKEALVRTKNRPSGDGGAKKLKIDQSRCIQCGTCVVSYADLFEFVQDSTKVKVRKDADFEGKDLERIKSVCPSAAIVDA